MDCPTNLFWAHIGSSSRVIPWVSSAFFWISYPYPRGIASLGGLIKVWNVSIIPSWKRYEFQLFKLKSTILSNLLNFWTDHDRGRPGYLPVNRIFSRKRANFGVDFTGVPAYRFLISQLVCTRNVVTYKIKVRKKCHYSFEARKMDLK